MTRAPVPVVDQIRIYWGCSPPRTGRQRMRPARSTARETGASFSNARCVRTSIIFQVRQQYVTEVPLSEHNNVVKAFPSDRTDQPFGVSILPRGAWRRWSVANAHRSKPSDEDIAIGPIAIADQIVGNLFPAACFRDLICDPFRGWMRCDAKP